MPKPSPFTLIGRKLGDPTAPIIPFQEKNLEGLYRSELANTLIWHHKRINSSGVEGFFIDITLGKNGFDRIGVKLYNTKETRDFAWAAQKKYNERKVAPRVGGKFELRLPSLHHGPMFDDGAYKKMYGYVTEVADILHMEDYGCMPLNESRKLIKFKKMFKKAKLPIADLHNDNLGWIGEQLVAVDFGPVSCCTVNARKLLHRRTK